MPRRWCWFAASALAVAALAVAAPPAPAATVLERRIVHTVTADGAVEETTRLRVRLERAAELSEWSPYYVYLDDNRTLTSLDAWALSPGGRAQRVDGRRRDTHQVAGGELLHSSARVEEVSFPPLADGAVLTIEHTVRVEPYFPAGAIPLTGGDHVASLEVEVRGAGAGWRWRIDGDAGGLEVEPEPGGIRVHGHDLAAVDPPELAPATARGPVLRYAWGEAADWPAVGRWYAALLQQVPRRDAAVEGLARELTAGATDAAERLAALTGFVQQKVRYVAVEVGVGGFRPSPPAETLARRWGDCKDKSLLLIDLLAAVGIEAFPALVEAAAADRIDRQFPSPGQFNHLIVAVPAASLGGGATADRAGGAYRFIDATQTRGGAAWLEPLVQGQQALVVRGPASSLVEIPLDPGHEVRRLTVTLSVGADGGAQGGAGLVLTGSLADGFLSAVAGSTPQQIEGAVRDLFGRLLPGVVLGATSASTVEAPVPEVSLAAAVSLPGLLPPGQGERPSFALPGLELTPAARHLAGRRVPVGLLPGVAEATWRLHLPGGVCSPSDGGEAVANAVGSFAQEVTMEEGTVVVHRRSELDRRWAEGEEELAALRDLSLAEQRSIRRRVRLACAVGGSDAGAGGEPGPRR
jgi:Transglutaminase-like superfamily